MDKQQSENNGHWKVGQAEFNGFVKAKLEDIERANVTINKTLENINKRMIEQGIQISALRVKASLWGALGGIIPACVVIGAFVIRELIK